MQDKNIILELDANIMVIEEIADGITKVAESFKKLKNSKLKEEAIILLLQNMIGSSHITKKQIKQVIECGSKLDKYVLK